MLTRSRPSQHKPTVNTPQRSLQADNEGITDGKLAPVTRDFLTSLFDSLKTDLQDLRKDLSLELLNLRSDLTSIGEWVLGLEDNEIERDEDVGQIRQAILRLLEQQDQLHITSKDVENHRSRRHNIRVRGASTGGEGEDIREYITALFCSVLGREDDKEILLDHVHRVGHQGGTGSSLPDILVCVDNFLIKEDILWLARSKQHIQFRGHISASFCLHCNSAESLKLLQTTSGLAMPSMAGDTNSGLYFVGRATYTN
ncbi:hypothetical protein NDU88_007013 [Pleurodeles waltl]|uniref:Uncharacterized protein n=1 Tax=Pleurodeles waltl TaxID=8319 RepID=A0AAV7VT75_PLEWA|nr:hypothetical protein NDU88_007013 [Pleurodeles waltl]